MEKHKCGGFWEGARALGFGVQSLGGQGAHYPSCEHPGPELGQEVRGASRQCVGPVRAALGGALGIEESLGLELTWRFAVSGWMLLRSLKDGLSCSTLG